MIRLATEQDIPWLVEQMLLLRQQTTWKHMAIDVTPTLLEGFLYEQLHAARSVCYVWDDPMDAFCGVSLLTGHLPPHVPHVFEWGWAGPPRHAVSCWRACTTWAHKHGALLACRSSSKPGPTICETLTWEKL